MPITCPAASAAAPRTLQSASQTENALSFNPGTVFGAESYCSLCRGAPEGAGSSRSPGTQRGVRGSASCSPASAVGGAGDLLQNCGVPLKCGSLPAQEVNGTISSITHTGLRFFQFCWAIFFPFLTSSKVWLASNLERNPCPASKPDLRSNWFEILESLCQDLK